MLIFDWQILMCSDFQFINFNTLNTLNTLNYGSLLQKTT
jgi:hypothetical protein